MSARGRCAEAVLDEGGVSLIELALLTPLLLLLLAGSVDLGRAFYAAVEVSGAAAAGAAYGVQHPTDAAGMRQAALLDAADLNGMQATAVYGCECSDGSSVSVSCGSTPACATNVVRYVEVQTHFGYTPLLRYPGVPQSLSLQGRSRLRASQ